ncbi:hypothetical protein P3T76_003746 [Phytophthora citrophthora]|uniref:Uncharacterized protein n=1 Tax=Phytophthora citrophthora TaxID=4793 RepID=A0AAD9GW83_9STRA|nr:hypothetical protein P3T76_003746 [Phytophthora citrophthora]
MHNRGAVGEAVGHILVAVGHILVAVGHILVVEDHILVGSRRSRRSLSVAEAPARQHEAQHKPAKQPQHSSPQPSSGPHMVALGSLRSLSRSLSAIAAMATGEFCKEQHFDHACDVCTL